MASNDKRTFNLPEKYAYAGGVIGNGNAIGVTDGEHDGVLNMGNSGGGTVSVSQSETSSYTLPGQPTNDRNIPTGRMIGICYDSIHSGIICEKDAQLKLCIKY